jgi:hypothetical protein
VKVWVQFLLCVLFSASIWLVLNLSQLYVAIVSVPVTAQSNIEGRGALSQSEATVTAQVSASGYRHVVMARRHRRTEQVSFAAADFRYMGGDRYAIPNTALYRYASQIFGEGVTVESFISEDPEFSFPEETYKKVPVRAVLDIEYAPQYMALKPLQVQPDSVLVYGEPSRLENVSVVSTKPLDLGDLRRSVHGKLRLETPSGVRLSHEECVYSLEVTRFVELRSEVHIGTRNVPASVDLAVLPSTATVVYRCIFPTATDPTAKAKFYIDYNDFAGSLSGRCVARCEELPNNVIDYTISPEVFDCLVKTAE